MAIQLKRKQGAPTPDELNEQKLLPGQPLVDLSTANMYVGGCEGKIVGQTLVEAEKERAQAKEGELTEAIAAEKERAEGIEGDIQEQFAFYQRKAKDKSYDAEGSSYIYTLEHNSVAELRNITALTIDAEDFLSGGTLGSCWFRIYFASSSDSGFTIYFPGGSKYIGTIPQFTANSIYEISVVGNVFVISVVAGDIGA